MDLSKFTKKRICVAVSGGVDSMTLLHFLLCNQERFAYQISAVHCEHGIRGENSLADARFVEKICQDWGITLYNYAEDCPQKAQREKCSLETAARNFRYDCFAEIIQKDVADYIATAHHKNDEAETILFRLARGTSLSGVKGMTEQRDWLIRPFLDWTREEIENYAAENHIQYCTDATNFERDATRNKLRLEVLPKLEEVINGATSNLVHFASLAAEDDALLYEYSQELLSTLQETGGYLVAFSDRKPLFSRACLTAIKGLGVEKDYTTRHLDALFQLQKSERGAVVCLPQNLVAKKTEKGIVLYIPKEEIFHKKTQPKKFTKNGFDGGRYEVNVSNEPPMSLNNTFKILKIDAENLPKNVVFRFREEGDVITSFGGGTKTLKKFFNEKKIPVEEREYLPLIAEEKGEEVYVICGVEISEKVKITPTTREIVYITMQKK